MPYTRTETLVSAVLKILLLLAYRKAKTVLNPADQQGESNKQGGWVHKGKRKQQFSTCFLIIVFFLASVLQNQSTKAVFC